MNFNRSILALALTAASLPLFAAQPIYEIFDMGVVGTDTASQGVRMSGNGQAVGRSLSNQASAISWTFAGGTVGLPKLLTPARTYHVGNGVNNLGDIVGMAATTAFGSGRLPVQWKGGAISQVPMPAGQTSGQAWDINDSGKIIGSVNSGSLERAFFFDGSTSNVITATAPGGQYFVTAYGLSNTGIVVGQGWDPGNAAITVGFKYDSVANTSDLVPPAIGDNSLINFDISENGEYITGSSSFNGSGGKAVVWNASTGTTLIPPTPGASFSSGRGVNNSGWTVGNSSTAFSIPWLNDGTSTYRVADLINNYATSGWDLLTNTSSSALGISNDGWITGTGVKNTKTRGYVMKPLNVPISCALTVDGLPNLPNLQPEPVSIIIRNRMGQTNVLARYPFHFHQAGRVDFDTKFVGDMTVVIKGRSWLAKAVDASPTAVGPNALSFSITNGDCDGDNEIGPADFDLVVAKFGLGVGDSGYSQTTDLDRDGEIGPSDFDIVVSNFGLSGDEF